MAPFKGRRVYTLKHVLHFNRFNVAEIGAMSRDIPHEAKVLTVRMTADPKVNITAHWKV